MNDYPNEGGSYLVNEKGERVRIEPPTQDHPDGNRARPAEHPPSQTVTLDELITDAQDPAPATPRRAK